MHFIGEIPRANSFDHFIPRREQREAFLLVLEEYSLSLDVIPLWLLLLTCSNLPLSN